MHRISYRKHWIHVKHALLKDILTPTHYVISCCLTPEQILLINTVVKDFQAMHIVYLGIHFPIYSFF